jgi:hypothetical protein
MALSTIDGAVLASELRRSRKNIRLYKTVRFALADGGERTLKNLVATDGVAAYLEPGSRGRFYMHSYLDARGLHGFRGTEGTTSGFAFPAQNERIFQIVLAVNLFWILFRLFVVGDGVPLLGLGLAIVSVIGWVWSRRTRIEAQRHFADDGGSPLPTALASQPA